MRRLGNLVRGACLVAVCCVVTAPIAAGQIDTDSLERPWPQQRQRHFEVGKYDVLWRERISKTEGLFAGADFIVPLAQQPAFEVAARVNDLSRVTPSIKSIEVLEETDRRQVILIVIEVLWKELSIRFIIEKEPPEVIRFVWTNKTLGEYQGVCRLRSRGEAGTAVSLSTWLRPARPIPLRVIRLALRMTMLQGVKGFLELCEEDQEVNEAK